VEILDPRAIAVARAGERRGGSGAEGGTILGGTSGAREPGTPESEAFQLPEEPRISDDQSLPHRALARTFQRADGMAESKRGG